MRPTLRPRALPLTPAGLHASGAAARALARLWRDHPARAARVSAVSVGDEILALGDGDALPWVDGATWLGREPLAPGLLLPTRREVSIHPILVARALARERGESAFPIAVLERGDGLVVISLATARRPGHPELSAFLDRVEGR